MIRAFFVAGFFTINVSVAHADDFISPLPPQLSDGSQRAFPTAEGYGAMALGGRGGKVIHVTNLNDGGVGSLRNALENESSPRTIVFDVGVLSIYRRTLKLPMDTSPLLDRRPPVTAFVCEVELLW